MSSSNNHVTEFRLKKASLSMERLDGEVIAIDFSTGKYFSFQRSAADLMWLLQREIPRKAWFLVVQEAFDLQATPEQFLTQVDQFLSELQSLDLVEPVDWLTGLSANLPGDYVRGAWEAPQIMVEEDLSDLLVIDPIHDTGEDGWPEIKQV